MLMSVYLHPEISGILKCYGSLSEVINKILDAASEGHFSVMDKPMIPNRDGAKRFDIDVVNEEYLELIKLYPQNSVKISLRRLLYWFVENEMYDFLGWKAVSDYKDNNTILFERLIKRIRQNLEKLSSVAPVHYKNEISDMLTKIKSMEL